MRCVGMVESLLGQKGDEYRRGGTRTDNNGSASIERERCLIYVMQSDCFKL